MQQRWIHQKMAKNEYLRHRKWALGLAIRTAKGLGARLILRDIWIGVQLHRHSWRNLRSYLRSWTCPTFWRSYRTTETRLQTIKSNAKWWRAIQFQWYRLLFSFWTYEVRFSCRNRLHSGSRKGSGKQPLFRSPKDHRGRSPLRQHRHDIPKTCRIERHLGNSRSGTGSWLNGGFRIRKMSIERAKTMSGKQTRNTLSPGEKSQCNNKLQRGHVFVRMSTLRCCSLASLPHTGAELSPQTAVESSFSKVFNEKKGKEKGSLLRTNTMTFSKKVRMYEVWRRETNGKGAFHIGRETRRSSVYTRITIICQSLLLYDIS